jgi:hypothetical protein
MTLAEARVGLRFSVRVIRVIREQMQHGPMPVSEIWRAKAAARIKACRAVIAEHARAARARRAA